MSIDKIDDYSDFNKPPYLLHQFVGTDVEKLLNAIDAQFNELETAFYDMLSCFDLDEAVGAQLDVLGIHLALSRQDRLDALYRGLLQTKVYIDTSGGTAETIIDAIRMLYGASEIHYTVPSAKNIAVSQDGLIGLYAYWNIRLDDDSFLVDFEGNSLVFQTEDDGAVTILDSVIPTGSSLTVTKIS